jgi:aspartate/methionine/tyrosine aminotransferase
MLKLDSLFDSPITPRSYAVQLPAQSHQLMEHQCVERFSPQMDQHFKEIFERAKNPENALELHQLFLSRVECELGELSTRKDRQELWKNSRKLRTATEQEILSSPGTVTFIKELFNSYFRDDLYGEFQDDSNIIFSSGSLNEELWGLPNSIKQCLHYSLDRDWYGYSDSCGRIQSREALAAYESCRVPNSNYTADNVAITMGATMAMSALSDFIFMGKPRVSSPALCVTPNYPPLVESISRRTASVLVPVSSQGGYISLDPLIEQLRPDTPLVFLQTVINPTGERVPEAELIKLINAASPTTIIILDECHEWLGEALEVSPLRASSNIIRIASLSKTFSAPGLKVGWFVADKSFIKEYYEHASTTYGGPPSFYFTLIEVLARFERWILEGKSTVGQSECNEFEETYLLQLKNIRHAFETYQNERAEKNASLTNLRDESLVMTGGFAKVIPAKYSINIAAEVSGFSNSYLCFRKTLHTSNVSMLPGVLNFCMSKSIMRISTAGNWPEMKEGFDRLTKASAMLVG